MEVLVHSQLLAKNLHLLKRVISNGTSLPILSCFLFDIQENKLKITASDLDVTFVSELECESKENGLFAVGADIILDILKFLPEQQITMKFLNKNLEIESLSGNYTMAIEDGAQFPKAPILTETTKIEIPSHILLNGISKTSFCVGTDEIRAMLTGVCFDLKIDRINFVATDANKLVKYSRTDLKSNGDDVQFIVPRKPISILSSALNGIDEVVDIEFNGVNTSFTFGNQTIVCRLIDAKYPAYESVIPKENPNTLEIKRDELLGSIKRINIFSNKTTHQVILEKKGNQLTIFGEDKDYSNKGTEVLTCIGQGEDLTIGFNSKYLMEMLSNLSSERVKLEMSQPNRAGILFPSEKNDEHEEITMLVMPVMIQS